MDTQDRSVIIARFDAFVEGRNFVTFDELSRELNVDREVLISLKQDFEAALKRHDLKIFLTSRIDLDPPGFEIRE